MFTQHADYTVPLLRLLADLPGGAGTREEVLNQFLQRFRLRYRKITSSLCLQAARKNGPNTWVGRTGTSRTWD